jgi:hypothetical protein
VDTLTTCLHHNSPKREDLQIGYTLNKHHSPFFSTSEEMLPHKEFSHNQRLSDNVFPTSGEAEKSK